MTTTKLVTVTTAMNGTEAQFIANRLREAGIEAAIADDNVVTMDFMFGPAVGWIKVQVKEQDVAQAHEVLSKNLPETMEEDIPWDQQPEEEEEEDEADQTPEERTEKIAERSAPVIFDESSAELEQQVARAYRMAICGFFLAPPLLNLYSIWLLHRADQHPEKFTQDARRHSTLAFFINMFSIVGFGIGWLWILGLTR